jgi:hypothetical protein
MSDDQTGTSSSGCSNPECQFILGEYKGIEQKVDHELWRASQALERARALRACAGTVLYMTAIYHVIFSDNQWARFGAVVMILACYKAIHTQG